MGADDAITLAALRRAVAARLKAGGIDAADTEARLIVGAASGLDPTGLLAHGSEAATPRTQAGAEDLLARRLAGEPVARLIGRREFWSLDFALSPDTLVPRPDTETVVEAALALVADRAATLRVLDLGTGSGAILAALLTELPNAFGIGVDLSAGAARAACDNLARLGLADRSAVAVGHWGGALSGGFDLLVSNPPYIPTGDLAGLDTEVRVHDPALALDGGQDGLDAYRAIARQAGGLLTSGGILVVELGIGQEPAVAQLLREAGLTVAGPARADLAGIPRALAARKP
ncbi:peptide chain release factor N(5)-glutamine methyltransferase [Xanthobacter tagetidis]|uniref:Release factor glutamine methyltransferase n=1 Tax=Xanthobacter tagetidis TaxID=60216 RepID=A0A3L7A9K6_9HYPH|nr:peptide chain release factor N(5)-glutamine methyltransferase [Xanthobacter tagetidis]MBB6308399.1 release factor glutamine methyltransferase [Xanthobacter tagetidis]RLP76261.1 peptide chain release factor N(5)-glutamine methyltransferase [Xanthobacter tagetidis]